MCARAPDWSTVASRGVRPSVLSVVRAVAEEHPKLTKSYYLCRHTGLLKRSANHSSKYRTLAIITRGFYYFSAFSHVGFSLMFGGIPLKLGGYKTRVFITRARLIMAIVR